MSSQGDEPELWTTDDPPTHANGGGRGPGGRSRMRWVAIAVGFAALIAVIAAQHYLGGGQGATTTRTTSTGASPTISSAPSTGQSSRTSSPPSTGHPSSPSPSLSPGSSPSAGPADLGHPTAAALHTGPEPYTTTLTAPFVSLPQNANWEVVGFQWSHKMSVKPFNVIRYRPSTQTLTTTPLPAPASTGTVSFVVTRHAAIVRPWDRVPGYLVQDGHRATKLTGSLASGGTILLPGPDENHVWVISSDNDDNQPSIREVGIDGKPTGTAITVPKKVQDPWFSIASDGAGYLLSQGPQGVYDLRPDGAHLVTHGQVLAAGPTGYVINDCDDVQCGMAVIGRSGDASTPVPGPPEAAAPGIVSPDGRFAAVGDASSASVTLTNLATGRSTTVSGFTGTDARYLSQMAFTPNSDYLLVVTADGLVPVDTATLTRGPTLAIPDLVAIAIRPLS